MKTLHNHNITKFLKTNKEEDRESIWKSMESTSSRGGGGEGQHIRLPPGFRFHPTDEELVVHYLQKRAASAPIPAAIITEIDLYKFDPWELPGKACFGEQEWYFFSPRERKYPNGERPNRAATSGYWKATGTDKPILTANGTKRVGVKKALVFYGGKPPKGIKTNWIMHEYRLVYNNSSNNNKPPGITNKGSSRLDDWVLCRIFMKSNWSSQPVDNAHEPTSSIDVHNQSPIFNQEPEKPWNFFSAAPPSEKGSAIPFASSSSPSKSSYFSSQFLNEMPANDHQTLAYSGNQVEDSSTHDEGNNPTPINGTSFISLLNQQYSNPSGDFDGGGDLASILPTSQFPSSVNK